MRALAAAVLVILLFALLTLLDALPVSANEPTPLPTLSRQPTYTPLPTATRRPTRTPTPNGIPTNTPYVMVQSVTRQPAAGRPELHEQERPSILPLALVGVLAAGAAGVGLLLVARVLLAKRRQRHDPDHQEIQAARKRQAQIRKNQEKAAKRVARKVQGRLVKSVTQLGLTHTYKEEKRRHYQTVKFSHVLITDGAMYFRIGQTPFRISYEKLFEREVLEHVSIAIGRQVEAIRDVLYGGYYVVHLKTGIRRIPAMYQWCDAASDMDVLDHLPKSRPLAVAIGMAENRKLLYEDLREWPHLMIGGATKWGKTTWIHQAICTLISRNTPDDLRLVLFDFKRLELRYYRDIPHLFNAASIITDREQAIAGLRMVEAEMERRLDLLEAVDAISIDGYNYQKKGKRLPYIVMVIDELADLMLTGYKKDVENLLQRLAQLARVTGIHAIVATQIPLVSVITTAIKGNLVARLAFNCASYTESKTILDHGGAKGLEAKGRLIYQFAGAEHEAQGPWISIEQVQQVVNDAITGETSSESELAVPPMAMFRHSIADLGGTLGVRQLYAHFKTLGASYNYITRSMQEYEYDPERRGPVITMDARSYIAVPGTNGGAPRKPRRLYQLPDPDNLPDVDELAHLIQTV